MNETELAVLKSDEPAEKTPFWEKPDIVDITSLLLIMIYFVAIFMNVTLLNSADASERRVAIMALAIALLGVAGLALKNFADKLMDDTGLPLTRTVFENVFTLKGAEGLLKTFVTFIVAFLLQAVLGALVTTVNPLSSFTFSIRESGTIFAIVTSTSEEMLFTVALLPIICSIFPKHFKWLSIPAVTVIFTLYHVMVYEQVAELLYVALARVVYAVVYLLSRRTGSIMLAHLCNNILASINLGMV